MRRPNTDKEKVTSRYFTWLVWNRDGTFYADGRGNLPRLGRYSLGTSQRKEALSNLELLDRKLAAETGKADRRILDLQGDQITLTEGRRLYEEYISRPAVTGGTRASTQKRYRAVLDKFLAFAKVEGLRYWSEVTKGVLERYARHLEDLGKEYNTQYLELTTLKQINKWLIGEGRLTDQSKITLKLPRDKETTTYCWTVPEFQAIITHCAADTELYWLGDLCLALGFTGMRISELAQLRWSNIDLEAGVITLVDESRKGKGTKQRAKQTLKGKRGRSFPIHDQLRPLLERLPHHADGYVFHGPRGGRIKPDTVRRLLIKDVLDALKERFPSKHGDTGFSDGRLHSFRHFFCSVCANSGVAERVVMDWLGHANAEMVRRYYHLDAQESRRQMSRVAINVAHPTKGADGVRDRSFGAPDGEA